MEEVDGVVDADGEAHSDDKDLDEEALDEEALDGDDADRRALYRCNTYRSSDQEYSECACTDESANGNYCRRWYCEETASPPFTGTYLDAYYGWYYYYTPPEYEWYECLAESTNGLYCDSWKTVGLTEPDWWSGELATGSCRCTSSSLDGGGTATTDSDLYPSDNLVGAGGVTLQQSTAFEGRCTRWACEENGWDYWEPSWTAFGIILAVFIIGSVISFRKNTCDNVSDVPAVVVVILLILILVFIFMGFWSAGVPGGVVYIIVALVVLSLMLRSCLRSLFNNCASHTTTTTRITRANQYETAAQTQVEMGTIPPQQQPMSIGAYPMATASPYPVAQATAYVGNTGAFEKREDNNSVRVCVLQSGLQWWYYRANTTTRSMESGMVGVVMMSGLVRQAQAQAGTGTGSWWG